MKTTNVALAFAAAIGICASVEGQTGTAGVVAIVGVSVVPMDRETVLANQTVIIRDGKIATVGAAASTEVPQGAVRVDGTGKFLIPALAEMHAVMRPGTTFDEVSRAGARGVARAGSPVHWGGDCGYPVGAGFPPHWGEYSCQISAGDQASDSANSASCSAS